MATVITVTATVIADKAGVQVNIAVTPTTVTRVSVMRRDPDGFLRYVLSGTGINLTGGAATVYDYEAPMDRDVTYLVTQLIPDPGANPPTGESAPVQVPSGGLSWLKDPGYPSMNLAVPIVTSLPELTRTDHTGVFPVIDRANPIVVGSRREGPKGTLTVHTATDAERASMDALLDRGTVLLFQTPVAYGWGSRYVAVGETTQARVGLAMEPMRRWTLPIIVVDRPVSLDKPQSADKTWGGVKATYPTWKDLKATGKTWRQLLEDGP